MTEPKHPCPMCNATGERLDGLKCDPCDGTGKISRFWRVDTSTPSTDEMVEAAELIEEMGEA